MLEYTFTVSVKRLREVLEPFRDAPDDAVLRFTLGRRLSVELVKQVEEVDVKGEAL